VPDESPSRRTANYYAGRAEDYYKAYIEQDRRINDYVNQKKSSVGVMLHTDIPLLDMVADRNRFIQLVTMFSNLSLMHRLLVYGE
jgi:2-phosphoglycerate kinase